MNYDVKNKKQFFVASGNARTTGSSAIDLYNIAEGQVVLSPMNGKTLEYFSGSTAYDAYDTMQIVAKRNGEMRYSTPFKYNKIRAYTAKAYAADTQFVYYIGYNGTSGQIEGTTNIVTGTNYNVTLRKRSMYKNTHDVYLANKPAGYYSGDATTVTQEELALGLYESMSYAFSGSIDGFVKVELLYSGASTILGSSRTLTLVNGSEIATASNTGHNLVAGDYVRIGHATTETYPVYLVSSVDGVTITLSTPYAGASASGVAAGEVNDPTTGDWGIKLTGISPRFSVGKFYYDLYDCDVWLNNAFVNTDITYTTPPKKGRGVGNEIYEMDWQNEYATRQGTGEYNRPPRNFMEGTTASTSVNYDLIVLEVENETSMFAAATHTQYTQIVVAIPAAGVDTTTQGDSHTSGDSEGIAKGLDEWLTYKIGTNPNQTVNLTV